MGTSADCWGAPEGRHGQAETVVGPAHRSTILTVALVAALSWAPVGSATPPAAPAPAPPPAAATPGVYANTPPELRPFSRFVQEPYSQHFVDKLEYFGPGRTLPEPQVETVRIGLLTPLSRSHEAYIGQEILHGSELALDEANAAGGYQGKPFSLVVRNDTGLWGASANEIMRFAHDDQVRLVIGTVDGANTHIAIRVALKLEIPMITVGDLDPTLAETKIPWIFRVTPDDRQLAYTLAFYLYRQLGLQRVAVLRANNRYGRFGVGEFLASSIRLGQPAPLEVNYETTWERTNPEFTMQLERLAKANPQALVLWADAAPAGRIVRRLREAGIQLPVFACDRVVHPDFFAEAGAAAEGVVAATPYDPGAGNPGQAAFAQAYRARFGSDPTGYAAHAYDGTRLGLAAIGRAGLNWARIRDALAEATTVGVTGDIRFAHDLSNRRRVTLATARGGKFVFGEPHAEERF